MSTKEEKESLRKLVQHVSRAFYEPKYTIILDQLSRFPVLKDDDLAGRMGLQPKELNKVIAQLSNDCLVKIFRQNELKEGAQRSVGKQYYYIDYEHFCNVVKWRVAKMWNKIDHKLRNEIENKGYICPRCSKQYTPLEVDKIMDFERAAFICEDCQAEVIENEDAESLQGSKDRMMRFNHQLQHIREYLQKSEAMTLPSFDVAGFVKKQNAEEAAERKKANGGGEGANGGGGGLKVAGADSTGPNEQGVAIVMDLEDEGEDEEKKRKEREAEAEQRRKQNALPDWHLKSTITGEYTSLGHKEIARAAAVAAQTGATNDESLRGLGIAGMAPKPTPMVSMSIPRMPKVEEPIEEAKPMDKIEQYYASLAAASRAGSTPVATPSSAITSDYGAYDGDEDRKPSIQYLDSLTEYRKRSRSEEDVGAGSKTPKMPRTEDNSPTTSEIPEPTPSLRPADEPLVYVNGTPKPVTQVTEEDHELMTPEEYSAYFEVLEAYES